MVISALTILRLDVTMAAWRSLRPALEIGDAAEHLQGVDSFQGRVELVVHDRGGDLR